MKTRYLLVAGIIWAFAFHSGLAQDAEKTFPNDSAEKNFYEEKYDVSKNSPTDLRSSAPRVTATYIWNKSKGEGHGHGTGGCSNIKESAPIADVIKKALSKEKIKLLASDNSLASDNNVGITVYFLYNVKTGKVVDTNFTLRGISLSDDLSSETALTLRDIYRLETLLKGYRFIIPEFCANQQTDDPYGRWIMYFRFSKLVEEAK